MRPPSRSSWLRYALGGTLPVAHRTWVQRDLTGPGWRWRVLGRVALQISPFVLAALVVPGLDPLARGLLVAILPVSALMTIAMAAEQVRDRRLRQHGLPLPPDPDREWRERQGPR